LCLSTVKLSKYHNEFPSNKMWEVVGFEVLGKGNWEEWAMGGFAYPDSTRLVSKRTAVSDRRIGRPLQIHAALGHRVWKWNENDRYMAVKIKAKPVEKCFADWSVIIMRAQCMA